MFDPANEPKSLEEMAERYKLAARRLGMRDPTRPPPVVFKAPEKPKPEPEHVEAAYPKLGRRIPATPDRARQIISDVAKRHKVSLAFMLSRSRMQSAVRARQEAMWLLYVVGQGKWSTTRIGQWLDGRDHSTVIHGIRVASQWMGRIDDAW